MAHQTKTKQPPKSPDTHKNLPQPQRVHSYQPHKAHQLPKSPDPKPPKPLKKKKLNWKRALTFVIALVLTSFIFIAAWDAHNFSTAANKLFGSSDLISLVRGGGPITDNNGRVNILIVGYSVDDPGHPAAKLTDSLLILSMNPANDTGYMLSIPRDLYVQIPGFGQAKINEAYQDGGIKLLESIVETNFKINLSNYLIVNYTAVKDTVNALGGITVNIKSPDSRGLYDPNISKADKGPLKLKNGSNKLNGQTALNLTRARGDAYNSYGFPQADFDRTQHQRQVFVAIKSKINWHLVLNPRKNGQLFKALGDNLKTDIKIGQVRGIFGLFNSIPDNHLKSLSLRDLNGTNYLTSYTTPYGQSALIPAAGLNNYSQIDAALQKNSK